MRTLKETGNNTLVGPEFRLDFAETNHRRIAVLQYAHWVRENMFHLLKSNFESSNNSRSLFTVKSEILTCSGKC